MGTTGKIASKRAGLREHSVYVNIYTYVLYMAYVYSYLHGHWLLFLGHIWNYRLRTTQIRKKKL
jgi:hypothetical protein